MAGIIRQDFNAAALTALLRKPEGGLARDLLRRGLRVQTVAKRRCPADSGRLRGSITLRFGYGEALGAHLPFVEVGTNVDYALMVHQGTGVYGPRGQVIVPRQARYLVFTVRGSRRVSRRVAIGGQVKRQSGGKVVMVRSVKGQPAKPFLKDALVAARG